MGIMTEDQASKIACQKLREHYIGMVHPNIEAYDDAYVIRNYPFEWGMFMGGWQTSKKIGEDIRNKLTPIKNLIAILENSDLMYHGKTEMHFLAEKELQQAKENIEYLSKLL